MTDDRPIQLLTRKQQAKAVSRIASLARPDASLIRCVGDAAEHQSYLEGSMEIGWELGVNAVKHDLLLSMIGTGSALSIVSLCRVERVHRGAAVWDKKTDVAISPPLPWLSVMQAAGLSHGRQPWRALTGTKQSAFLDALAEVLRSNIDVTNKEGKRQLISCRRRSRANRRLKLDEAQGICSCCNANLRAGFGARGDRGLEVHHLIPLSACEEEEVVTSLADLIVLCATCHRLLHADPELNLDTVRAGWPNAR